MPVSLRDVIRIQFILAPSPLRSLCSHGQQHYSVACQLFQDAWVLVTRSRTSAVHGLKMLIHYQDNGSIMCSLITIAQFGREEAGRLSLPSHDDQHE